MTQLTKEEGALQCLFSGMTSTGVKLPAEDKINFFGLIPLGTGDSNAILAGSALGTPNSAQSVFVMLLSSLEFTSSHQLAVFCSSRRA
jgi:hypothetical protein